MSRSWPAKNLLTDYKDQFGELDPLGTAYFVAGQVLDTVAERTAVREVISRLADEAYWLEVQTVAAL